MSKQQLITIGKITAVFGIKGWLKVFSYTEPKENILRYKQLQLVKQGESKMAEIIGGQLHGKNALLQFLGVNDRDQAQLLVGSELAICRDELPPAEENEYYWADLIGLSVENMDGVPFGKVVDLLATGANDVLLVEGDKERAVPFLQGQTVRAIDLASGKMVVDWDPDF